MWFSLLFVFVCHINLMGCVQLDDDAQSYLKEVLKQFAENPTDSRFDHVIEPPGERPYLPALFVWAPMEHFKFTMKCLKHPTCDLRTAGWTDDLITKRSNKNPRLIFDLRRNIILVQRFYTCRKDVNHHYMAASVELMSSFPVTLRPNHFPFKKYHMSVASFDLIDYIFSQVIHRLSFSQISEGISTINFAYFQRTIGFNEKNFHDNVLFSFPSRDKVQSIFLDTYYSIKQLLDSTRSLPSSSISIDHSYRIGRTYADKVRKEPMRIFTILNENHEIVSWKPTQGSCTDEYMTLLMELKYKLDVTGTSLSYVYLENCCDMRETYAALFPGIAVKLDPFHAFQPVMDCLPDKKVVHACIFGKDLRRILRQPGDNGEKREQDTASPSIIMQQLMDVISKQEAFINSLPGGKKAQVMTNIELLKEHIIMGCLSYIPADTGSESIEKYHQEFMKNDNLHSKYFILSPELAVAIFALLCAAYNSKSNIRKHSCNIKIVPYLPKTYISPFLQKPDDPEPLSIDDYALFTTGNIMTNNMLARLAYDVYYVYNFLKKMSHSCWAENFKVESAIKLVVTMARNTNSSQPTSEDHEDHDYFPNHKETLLKNLKQFNLTIDTVPSDGDCLFRSILMQVYKTLPKVGTWHQFTQHIEKLGLRSTNNEDELILVLRQHFVNEIKTEERYKSYLTNEDITDLDSFSLPGFYASNIGDLVVDASANILGTPIVVVSSITDMDVSIHLPKRKQLIDIPIVVAYNARASGHYDGTKILSMKLANNQDDSDFFCRCGSKKANGIATCMNAINYSSRCPCRNKGKECNDMCHCRTCGNNKPAPTKSDNIFCRCGESKWRLQNKDSEKATTKESDFSSCTKGKRATKCPCNTSQDGCNESCRCINCANEFGLKPIKAKIEKREKRKRIDKTYTRPKMADFSFDDETSSLQETEKDWTLEEIATILCGTNVLLTIPGSNVSAETVHLIYRSTRESYALNNMGFRLNMRTVEQIDEKMKELGLVEMFPISYIIENIEVTHTDGDVQYDGEIQLSDQIHSDNQVQLHSQIHSDNQVRLDEQINSDNQVQIDEQIHSNKQVQLDEQVQLDRQIHFQPQVQLNGQIVDSKHNRVQLEEVTEHQ